MSKKFRVVNILFSVFLYIIEKRWYYHSTQKPFNEILQYLLNDLKILLFIIQFNFFIIIILLKINITSKHKIIIRLNFYPFQNFIGYLLSIFSFKYVMITLKINIFKKCNTFNQLS